MFIDKLILKKTAFFFLLNLGLFVQLKNMNSEHETVLKHEILPDEKGDFKTICCEEKCQESLDEGFASSIANILSKKCCNLQDEQELLNIIDEIKKQKYNFKSYNFLKYSSINNIVNKKYFFVEDAITHIVYNKGIDFFEKYIKIISQDYQINYSLILKLYVCSLFEGFILNIFRFSFNDFYFACQNFVDLFEFCLEETNRDFLELFKEDLFEFLNFSENMDNFIADIMKVLINNIYFQSKLKYICNNYNINKRNEIMDILNQVNKFKENFSIQKELFFRKMGFAFEAFEDEFVFSLEKAIALTFFLSSELVDMELIRNYNVDLILTLKYLALLYEKIGGDIKPFGCFFKLTAVELELNSDEMFDLQNFILYPINQI